MLNKITISKSITVFALFIGVLGMSSQSASADWVQQVFGRLNSSRPNWMPQEGYITQGRQSNYDNSWWGPNGLYDQSTWYGRYFGNVKAQTGASGGLFEQNGSLGNNYGGYYGNSGYDGYGSNYGNSQCYDCGTYAGSYNPNYGSGYGYGAQAESYSGGLFGGSGSSWLSGFFGRSNNYGYSNGGNYDNNHGYYDQGYGNGNYGGGYDYYDNGSYYGDDVYYNPNW